MASSTPAIKLDFGAGGPDAPQSITIQPAKLAAAGSNGHAAPRAPEPKLPARPQQPAYTPLPPVQTSGSVPQSVPVVLESPQPQQATYGWFSPSNAQRQRSRGATGATPVQSDSSGLATARRPHPLLWVTLGISLLALILGVPKGTFPTLTGRHKVLRAQEVLVQERLALLNHLGAFLPPPLAALVAPDLDGSVGGVRSSLDLVRLGTGLQLWNVNPVEAGADGVFWTLEDLGRGASVVRSSLNGNTREVWVLRDGEGGAGGDAAPALAALAAALHGKERLARDLESCRAAVPGPSAATLDALPSVGDKEADAAAAARERDLAEREAAIEAREREAELARLRKEDRAAWEREHAHLEAQREAAREERERALAAAERKRTAEREERERESAARRRARELADEMEEREREVVRREKWVVDAMRKLAGKARENADELTMEDRVTERLKIYQRQLAELHAEL